MIGLVVRAQTRRDAGFTLVELLVAIVVLGAFGVTVLTAVLGANNSATAARSAHDINEEARLALNRIARELRQANAIKAVVNPDGPAYSQTAITAVTFTADFDGDGCIDGAAPTPAPTPAPTCNAANPSNPETLTYCWDPSASVRQLYLIAGGMPAGNTCQGGLPILAGQVTAFKLSYRSNLYLFDSNGDAATTWLELDQAGPPVGNQDGVLDQPELGNIDSVVIDLSVASGSHTQAYTTQVDLRNLS